VKTKFDSSCSVIKIRVFKVSPEASCTYVLLDDFWKASWELQTAVSKAALEFKKTAFKGDTHAV
jgi:hypothetical protein